MACVSDALVQKFVISSRINVFLLTLAFSKNNLVTYANRLISSNSAASCYSSLLKLLLNPGDSIT